MSESPPAIPIEVAREIARQGEVRVGATVEVATAADQRAMTLCGIFGAASIGVGAAVLAELTSDHPLARLVIPGVVVAVGWLIGAFLSAFAGAPSDFHVPGGDPAELRNWAWDGFGWRTEAEFLDATSQRYARLIEFNKCKLASGSKSVKIAILIALTSPMLGAAIFLLLPP